jgi:hypothetical protein
VERTSREKESFATNQRINRLSRPQNRRILSWEDERGCQMVYFQTKNPNLGKFWRAFAMKMLVYFIAIWNILLPFDVSYGTLVHLVVN